MASKKSSRDEVGPGPADRGEKTPPDAEERRPPAGAAEPAAREEKLTASLGDVLSHEHAEEASRLHVVKQTLPESGETTGAPAAPAAEATRERHQGQERQERQEKHARHDRHDRRAEEERTSRERPRRRLAQLASPFFLFRATRTAARELSQGLHDASRDLREALQRARHAFTD